MMAAFAVTAREAERMQDYRECPECNIWMPNEEVTWSDADKRLACVECRAQKPPIALLSTPTPEAPDAR